MIKHVHFVRKRLSGGSSRWYVYAWRGGPQIAFYDGAKRPQLSARDVKAIVAATETDNAPDPTTLLSLIRRWRSGDPARKSSADWERLSPGTKKTWGSALNVIEARWGDAPLAVFDNHRMVAKVMDWRDSRDKTPRAADIGVTVLSRLLEFGRLNGLVSINVAQDIPTLYRPDSRAEIIWLPEDCEKFRASAKALGLAHVNDGLDLAEVTGLRRADLVSLTEAHIGPVAIQLKAKKVSGGKQQVVTIPRVAELDDVLTRLRKRFRQPAVATLLVNSEGVPWTGDGFTGQFNRIRDHAKVVHTEDDGTERRKHLHDLRGSYATKIMTTTDLSDQEIAEIMGWAPDRVRRIRRVYVDQSSLIMALALRIQTGTVNRAVNQMDSET